MDGVNARIWIGEFSIVTRDGEPDTVYIEHDSGEAMGTPRWKLERAIRDFFDREF